MTLDIPTLALIQSLMFATQVLVLGLQFGLNRSFRGLGHWVVGAALMAVGVILMPLAVVKSLQVLALFSNPLYVLGLFLIHAGIVRFFGKKAKRWLVSSVYAAFLLLYMAFIFVHNDLPARTIVLNAAMAAISSMIAHELFVNSRGNVFGSARFVALVFSANAIICLARAAVAITMPSQSTYESQGAMLRFAFLYPTILSTFWTFGFVLMQNQRLNAENDAEKEKLKLSELKISQLARQLETERNDALLDSITDSLTGLPNRRKFDEVLGLEFRRLRRSGSILSLIMLDIDYFKDFNDTYGHPAGDECLRVIGGLFASILGRATDMAARYGGEEFAFILPETDSRGARALAERIRAAVEKLAIPHSTAALSPYVTVSLGAVSVLTTCLDSPERIVILADEALYRAKRAGRNRVEVSIAEDCASEIFSSKEAISQ